MFKRISCFVIRVCVTTMFCAGENMLFLLLPAASLELNQSIAVSRIPSISVQNLTKSLLKFRCETVPNKLTYVFIILVRNLLV